MKNNFYNVDNIFFLKGLEAVRKRPGMYIGDVEDGSGLHQMLFELISNSVDEVIEGYCDTIKIVVYLDNSVSVEDNGRGIPIDYYKNTNISICELLATELHSGGKFNNSIYQYSGGTHGVGLSVVNALSKKMQIIIFKNPFVYECFFVRGKIFSKLKRINICSKYGTFIRFYSDEKIFGKCNYYDINIIQSKLLEVACLNPNLNILLYDYRNNFFKNYYFKNGIKFLINYLSKKYISLNECFFFAKDINFCKIEIAFKWTNATIENIFCYTNSIFQIHGGTHLIGFKSGMTRFFNKYIKNDKNLKYSNILGDNIRIGLFAIISIKMQNPKFSSQIKDKLVSLEIKKFLDQCTYDMLLNFSQCCKVEFDKILNQILLNSLDHNLIKKYKKLFLNETKNISLDKIFHSNNKDTDNTELYIVEGESAGGSANQAKFSNQFVFPLRGKILNVVKKKDSDVFLCKEIINLLKCIGFSIIKKKIVLEKLLFNKIIIMTDADIDGYHILSLILSFFILYLPDLILKKKIYFVKSPLYSVNINNSFKFLFFKNSINLIKNFFLSKKKKIKNKYINFSCYSLAYYFNILNDFRKIFYNYYNFLIYFLYFPLLNINFFSDYNYLYNWISNFNNIFLLDIQYDILYSLKDKVFFLNIIFSNFNNLFIGFDFFKSDLYKKFFNMYSNIFLFSDYFFIYNSNINKNNSFLNIKKKYNFNIKRYKGLGEMNPDQLRFTTMDIKTRKMFLVTSNNIINSKIFVNLLLGYNSYDRKIFLKKNLDKFYYVYEE